MKKTFIYAAVFIMAVAVFKKKGSAGNPGSGRKPTGLKRVSFCVSCQPEELQQIKELAAEAGKTVSRFLLDAVLKD